MISIENAIPRADVLLGAVRAERVRTDRPEESVDGLLADLLGSRKGPLTAEDEARRRAARDVLRNGSYRPTGRGKPASEYLLRAANEEHTFPRINGPVDVCNFVSLKHVLPVSLWDLDRAEASRFLFRLGLSGERYVFNDGGQEIALEDLVVGCRVRERDPATGDPIVNPVKDCLATKTTPETRRVAACVYAPAAVVARFVLEEICGEFARLLEGCGDGVVTATAVVDPGSWAEL